MTRVHLFELGDQRWLPRAFHDYETDHLHHTQRYGRRLFGGFIEPIERLLDAAGTDRIVDLCAGGAGPWLPLLDLLAERGRDVRVTLTDIAPNRRAFAHLRGHGKLEPVMDPVDARQVPAALSGPRTIFNAFHHLRPEDARRVLVDAATQRQPIGVFEMQARSLPIMLAFPLIMVAAVLVVPLIRPFRWGRLFWTLVIPLMPAMFAWDGLVSALRVYSKTELDELIAGVDVPGYAWETGTIRVGLFRVPYLLGMPA